MGVYVNFKLYFSYFGK